MARKRLVPNKNELVRMIGDGMTHQDIADHVYKTTGEKVGRSAISVACHRHGITDKTLRYKDHIPWKVSMEHMTSYPLRMLRHMGRLESNASLNPSEEYLLGGWLARMDREQKIVAYHRLEGPIYVDAKLKDHDLDIPIRIGKL